jgi:hypothetical protein
MSKLRTTLLLLAALTAFTACKKGGGYLHLAPAPALSR